MTPDLGDPFTDAFEPMPHLEMQGIGYRHPEWSHGVFRMQELDVAREDFRLSDSAPQEPHRWHRQLLCRVTRTAQDGATEQGTGILEHLFIGEHGPLGLT